jgi:hypothetical protein
MPELKVSERPEWKGPESSLGQRQRQFTEMVGRLIAWSYSNGFELTFGEAFRTPEQAALNAKKGIGIFDSLHCSRLAIDLNLFIGGVYQQDFSAYLPLGEFWESIGGAWGGRFMNSRGEPKPDANHFSLAFGGRK